MVAKLDCLVYPTDLLKELALLAGDKPLGVLDPQKSSQTAIEELAYRNRRSRGQRLGIFRRSPRDPRAKLQAVRNVVAEFSRSIEQKAQAGVGIVWIQPARQIRVEPSTRFFRRGPGVVAVTDAAQLQSGRQSSGATQCAAVGAICRQTRTVNITLFQRMNSQNFNQFPIARLPRCLLLQSRVVRSSVLLNLLAVPLFVAFLLAAAAAQGAGANILTLGHLSTSSPRMNRSGIWVRKQPALINPASFCRRSFDSTAPNYFLPPPAYAGICCSSIARIW